MAGGTTEEAYRAFLAFAAEARATGAARVRDGGLEIGWHAPPEGPAPESKLEASRPLNRTERDELAELRRVQRMAEELP